jgi:hypothetical protein
MEGDSAAQGNQPGHRFSGVSIKNEPFTVSAARGIVRLEPESKTGNIREFTREALFDAVPEIDGEGLPALALAINTPGGIRRMVLSFPEWAGGTQARDRLEVLIRTIIQGTDESPAGVPDSDECDFSGILIKGERYSIGISPSGITVRPDDRASKPAGFPLSAVMGVDPEPGNGRDPSLALSIRTSGGIRRMILSFPGDAGGSSARDRAISMIRDIRGDGAPRQNTPAPKKAPSTPFCSFTGITIKDIPFRSDLYTDRICLIPEAGDGTPREFRQSEIFDIVPEFTPEGLQSAVLAIATGSGIRRLILCFPSEKGGSFERDRFIVRVQEILDGTAASTSDTQSKRGRAPARIEYPICQRSELLMDNEQVGLLLTSKRLIIYDGDGTSASVREAFRSSQILDASPTIDLSGMPALTISLISKEKEIFHRIIVFEDEDERDTWIAYLTADETPPPMIEGEYDDTEYGDHGSLDEEVDESEEGSGEDDQDEEETPPPPEDDQKPPPPVCRCPVCETLIAPESPWCDTCGVRLSPDHDWRGLSEYVLQSTEDDPLTPRPKREYGRLLTFLIAPSGAGRFRDDPIQLPLTFFLTSMLVCILGNVGIIDYLAGYAGLDPALYPAISGLITDPATMVVFTLTTITAASVAALIAAFLAFLITGMGEGSFRRLLRITLYSALPFGIAGLIPVIGLFIAGIWSILTLSGALRSTFDFSIPASFFPPVASYGAALFAGILLSGGIL